MPLRTLKTQRRSRAKELAVRYDRGSPQIVVINQSKHIEPAELKRVVGALQKQIDYDFFPLWGWRADLVVGPHAPRRGVMKIYLIDRPDEYAGYHFLDGLPITYVFTADESGNPVDYTATLSHEALEMIADPGVNLYAYGHYYAGNRKRQAWIPYEVCDPVEENTYKIDGVELSDFVVPEWFEAERKPRSMRFSFCAAVTRPFGLASGGYVDAIVGGRTHTVWGKTANRARRRHRQGARLKRAGLDQQRSPQRKSARTSSIVSASSARLSGR